MSLLRLDLPMARLQVARTLAWALLLGGWVGLGSLSQTLAPGPLAAFALLAAWLLALGAVTELIARVHLHHGVLRALLLASSLLAAWALTEALRGGGWAALVPALLAWALVVALAGAAVRACRVATATRAGSPIGAAAAGAALAWAGLGDITDLNGLGARLLLGALTAGLLLIGLLPRRSAGARGCRAALFDCSLPAWPSGGWREPEHWPVRLASLVMLPMMCGVPLMVNLCRSDAISPQVVLGVHFAAMFMPALVMQQHAAAARRAAGLCAALLALGVLAIAFAPGAAAWWGLVLAHGAAWSVAWAAQLGERRARASTLASPWRGAVLNALLTLTLGLAVASAGLAALTVWHLALGAVGAGAGVLAAASRRPRALPAR